MESTSSSEPWTPSPIPPMNGTVSRVSSQDYTTMQVPEEYEYHNDATVSSIPSKRSSLLLESTQRATLETISLATTIGSDTAVERPRSQSRFRDVREIVVKFWLWETAACIFSLASLASIVGVLIYEDGKPLDQWESSISPTAVVSFIGTLGKASLVLVLSQVLSQLKWLHFRETRSLRHVRIFDEASRGPLGAVMVILRSKKPLALASIAACIMTLTILVDPFVQLVFAFPSRLVEDDSQKAIFYRINDWNVDSTTPNNPTTGQLLQGITTSLGQALTSTSIAVTADCPSGNCAWPGPIKTLGVCGSCADVTADVKVACLLTYNNTQSVEGSVNTTTILACDYVFNNGYVVQAHRLDSRIDHDNGTSFQIARTAWNSTVTDSLSTTNSYPLNKTIFELDGQPVARQPIVSSSADGMYNNLYNLSVVQLPTVNLSEADNPMEMPAAKCWNCEIYLCEKSFENVQVTDNAPAVYTVSTKRLGLVYASDGNFNDDGDNGYYYGLYPSDINTLNETVWNFRYRLSDILDDYTLPFFDSYSVEFAGGSWTTDPHFWGPGHPLQADESRNVEFTSGIVMSQDLNARIRVMTDSLTEAIRTSPNATSVTGQTFVTKSFIQVRWAWLALPFTLSVVTCVLLLITAIKSHLHKIAVWKDDPLALLFHHVDGADILPGGNSKTGTSDLDNLADEVHIRLDGDMPFRFVVSAGKA